MINYGFNYNCKENAFMKHSLEIYSWKDLSTDENTGLTMTRVEDMHESLHWQALCQTLNITFVENLIMTAATLLILSLYLI